MREYIEKITELIKKSQTPEELNELLMDYHESDIADTLENIDYPLRMKLYRYLDRSRLSAIFSCLDNPAKYLMELNPQTAASLVGEMDSDDAVDILDELDDEKRKKIFELVKDTQKDDIELIKSYTDEELGSKMTNNYIDILNTDSIRIAMNKLVSQAATNDNVTIIYVLDEQRKYVGAIDVRDLFVARLSTKIDDIIKTNYPRFRASDDVLDVYDTLAQYALDSYPVLDDDDTMLGVVTQSDLIEIADEMLSDDYAKLAGLSSDARGTSIIADSKKRLPWLIILLFLDIVISFVISRFGSVVETLPALVFFQSLVLGISGNIGTQSLAVTIKALSNKPSKKELIKIVLRELKIGFLNGLILGGLSFGLVLAFLAISKTGVHIDRDFLLSDSLHASMLVAVALLCSMTVSALVGSLMPIFFNALGVDPSVASGPFITTINDIVGVVVYYGLALLLLSMHFL